MVQFTKKFINPLLANAFKAGVEFVNDPDYRLSEVRREGDKWVLDIFEMTEDDDGLEIRELLELPESKDETLSDYEKRFKQMKPISAPSMRLSELSFLPIKLKNELDLEVLQGCGKCIPCKTSNGDCIEIINATLIHQRSER